MKHLFLLLALITNPALALEVDTPLVCRSADGRLEVNYYQGQKNGPIVMRLFENGNERPSVTLNAQELVARCLPAPGTDGCPRIYAAENRRYAYNLNVVLETIERLGRAPGRFTIITKKTDRRFPYELTCELVYRAY